MQVLATSSNRSYRATVHPLKIVALGDSLVYGFGDPVGGGWVERLRREWMMPSSAGHVLYNLGVRGDRVCQVLERLENEFRYRGELKNSLPDAIILSVGVNDSARLGRSNGRNFTDFNTFTTEIAQLLDCAIALCPVFFVGMVPVNETQMPFSDCLYFNHADQYRYKEVTRQGCEQRQIPYLDLFELWRDRGEAWRQAHLCDDGLHPNVTGYQSLLQDILNWDVFTSFTSLAESWRNTA